MEFYKACFKEDLSLHYIPGTVTTDKFEAYKWFRRYSSKKKDQFFIKREGEPIIIKFSFPEKEIGSHKIFQNNVAEHNRITCWTSSLKTKAQINKEILSWKILSDNEILNMAV